jgi:hypothetical protein
LASSTNTVGRHCPIGLNNVGPVMSMASNGRLARRLSTRRSVLLPQAFVGLRRTSRGLW